MSDVSVVIPVLDGERYLEEVLAAVEREGPEETLVIDSGSQDRSVQIAKDAGVDVLEIVCEDFGHGRTRNLGVERTTGELICFLTQDATPVEGWLAAYREAFTLDPRVGAAFGPHLPRADSSPMIARELTEFFAGFSADDQPTIATGAGANAFLSNVNACYARECWQGLHFRDVPYAEDQAFGRDLLAAGWAKVYHPRAAVRHAHDYPVLDFWRRYFDEYRGLRQTIGHVEPFALRASAGVVRRELAADRRWMREQGFTTSQQLRWGARGALHHGGRRVFSALGSRAERLPEPVRQSLSLERRADADADPTIPAELDRPPTGLPVAKHVAAHLPARTLATVARVLREGPAPLLDPVPGMAERDRLHIAVAIPTFARGSGGHGSIFQIVRRLEQAGHTCSIWLVDPLNLQPQRAGALRQSVVDWFGPTQAPLFKGFDDWYGADVAVATGWQTVYPIMGLRDCRARGYLIHDHEPEFYATSAESWWAERTYRFDLYCIAASPWLLELVRDRYGRRGCTFQFGVDHDIYQPKPVPRRRDTVVFYSRAITARRAVSLGILALEELHRRRPDVRLVLFGDAKEQWAPFPYEHVGIASPEELAWLYSEATVGLCLSMTNYSLVPQEMMACGLPCVDLGGFSAESVFGSDGPVELADFDPVALADAIERLLVDEERWEHRYQAGRGFVAEHTWDAAAREVEAGLREALRERESADAGAGLTSRS